MHDTIKLETALMPAYYKDFHCIMGACQDNCCDDGWKIEFSKKDYLTVKRAVQDEDLKRVMSKSLRRLREKEHDGMYAEFCLSEAGRCAFHTPEGLCRLQLECGAESLPLVCRIYPRRTVYTPAAKELSLSPSCEGVLSLLWDLPDGVDFIEEPLHPKDVKTLLPSSPVSARFSDIRSLCIDVLQARSLRLNRRLLLLGLAIQDLKEQDWEEEGAIDGWQAKWEALLEAPEALSGQLEQMPRNQPMFLSQNLRTMFSSIDGDLRGELLAVVTGKDSLDKLDLGDVTIDRANYWALECQLDELLDHSDYFFENLMVTVAFYLTFPDGKSPEKLWKSYVNLCNIYSLYRFCAVCGCGEGASKERLFHVLVRISREILHNQGRQKKFQESFFQNDSATLAHMAILLGG